MFDIGFIELLAIAVVGLLVIGPEQLPGTVRTIMLWIGRLRRSFTQVRQEIEREIGAEDIRRQLHNESIMQELEKARDDIKGVAEQTENELKKADASVNQALESSQADER